MTITFIYPFLQLVFPVILISCNKRHVMIRINAFLLSNLYYQNLENISFRRNMLFSWQYNYKTKKVDKENVIMRHSTSKENKNVKERHQIRINLSTCSLKFIKRKELDWIIVRRHDLHVIYVHIQFENWSYHFYTSQYSFFSSY